jgi:predicted nucleic acid-binding protein
VIVVSVLLDTNVLIECLREMPDAIGWYKSLEDRPSISVVSLLELYAGVRSQREEREIHTVRQRLKCVATTEEISERAGSYMRHYRASHGIDIPDAIIAATAEQHGLRLATLNVKHFPMFPKLKRAY